VWALAQSRGDGHRSLVTPERVLSEYNLIFWSILIPYELNFNENQKIFFKFFFLHCLPIGLC